MSLFNPSQQLSTTQPLAHVHPQPSPLRGMERRMGKSKNNYMHKTRDAQMQLLTTWWTTPRPSPGSDGCPQPTPPAYILSMTWYGMEYACPSCVPSHLPMHLGSPGQRQKLKNLWQPSNWKHQYVIDIIFIPNPKHSATPATRKKINSNPRMSYFWIKCKFNFRVISASW